jgi:hypothetical protein
MLLLQVWKVSRTRFTRDETPISTGVAGDCTAAAAAVLPCLSAESKRRK